MPLPSWTAVALDYLAHGWVLTPLHAEAGRGCTCGDACDRPGRHPRFEDWSAETTAHASTVRAWGDLWEAGAAGLVVGPDSGVVALEVDPQAGGAWLKEMGRAGFRLPEASEVRDRRLVAVTRLFRYPLGLTLRAGYEVAPGVRIRCRGAVVPLPPRHLRASEDTLYWHTQLDAGDLPALPGWVWVAAGVDLAPASDEEGPGEVYGYPRGGREPSDPGALPFRQGSVVLASEGPPPWVVAPWVVRGGVTAVLGAPKLSGKTTFLLALARAAARGEPFLGSPSWSSDVVYLTEQGRDSLADGLRRAGFDRTAAARVHALHAGDLRGRSLPEVVDAVGAFALRASAQLVIVDSLDRFTTGVEPHVAVEALERLARLHLAVAVSVPTFADGEPREALGALGPLASAADVVLTLRGAPGAPANWRSVRAVSRYAETPAHAVVEWGPAGYRLASGGGGLFASGDAPKAMPEGRPWPHPVQRGEPGAGFPHASDDRAGIPSPGSSRRLVAVSMGPGVGVGVPAT